VTADGVANLTWHAPEGETPTGYRVYRNGELVSQLKGLSERVGGISSGQDFDFAVSAYSAYGESARTPVLTLRWDAPETSTTARVVVPTTVANAVPAPTTVSTTTVPTVVEPPGARYAISPASGSVAGGTVVSITGPGLDDRTTVDIDGAAVAIRSASGGNWLVGTTSAHVQPGTYDMTIHHANSATVVTRAFTYTGTVPGTTPVTSPPATTPPATSPPVTTPPATTPPVTSPPVTSPPVTSPPVTSPPVTSPPVTSPPGTSPPVTAPPAPRLGNLHLGPVPGRNPVANLPAGMWDGMTCRRPRCAG
jgi:hypothetical protein